MLNFFLIIGGLALTIFSAHWLVNGASSIAKHYGISDIVIGLTVVAFGTSAPELTINVLSAVEGSTDIAIGNILGSNIANILLILGIAAIIFPLPILKSSRNKEIPFSLIAAVVLWLLANDKLFDSSVTGNFISAMDGIILLIFFCFFLFYSFRLAKTPGIKSETVKSITINKSIFLILIGLTGLYFGGKYMVEGAINFASSIGMSQRVIGLTIVAIGTSIPELATSVVAALKKNAGIAVGNVVGSNIFNIFFVLGTTAVIKPLPFDAEIQFDVIFTIFASLLLFLTAFTFKKNKIDRIEGFFFLLIYIGYIVYTLM